jgi:hypothetical protein
VITVGELLGRTNTAAEIGSSKRTDAAAHAPVGHQRYPAGLEARLRQSRAGRVFTGLAPARRRIASPIGAVLAVGSLAAVAALFGDAGLGPAGAGALDGGYPGKDGSRWSSSMPADGGSGLPGGVALGLSPMAFSSQLGTGGPGATALGPGARAATVFGPGAVPGTSPVPLTPGAPTDQGAPAEQGGVGGGVVGGGLVGGTVDGVASTGGGVVGDAASDLGDVLGPVGGPARALGATVGTTAAALGKTADATVGVVGAAVGGTAKTLGLDGVARPVTDLLGGDPQGTSKPSTQPETDLGSGLTNLAKPVTDTASALLEGKSSSSKSAELPSARNTDQPKSKNVLDGVTKSIEGDGGKNSDGGLVSSLSKSLTGDGSGTKSKNGRSGGDESSGGNSGGRNSGGGNSGGGHSSGGRSGGGHSGGGVHG